MSSEEKKHEGVLTIDRAAFLLLRVKKAFKKKKQQRKEKSVVGPGPVVPEVKPVGPNRPPPLLRSRTLPAIVVPGLSILQAQIDARYRQDGEAGKKEKCKTPSRLQAPSIAFTDDSLVASQHFSLHRHSSPEPPPGVVDAVLRLPSPHVVAARAYRMSAPGPGASTTALYRLAKLLNQRGSTSSTGVASGDGTRRLSWERRETCQLPRSSSIDSVVEAAGGWGSSSGESTPAPPPRRLPSPLLQRPERPLTLVSPSVGRRMKGHRAVSGESR